MIRTVFSAAILVMALPASQALAQSSDVEDGPGTSYVASEHGAWDLRCVRGDGTPDICQLYQLLYDEAGNSVAEIGVFPAPPGTEAEAAATIITPLETLLTRNVRFSVDDGPVKSYPFAFCNTKGCVSQIGLLPSEVDAMKAGADGEIAITPAAARDRTVRLRVSLQGFTAGYTALQATRQ